jgi:hemerythrin
MHKYVWNENLSVGIDEFDEQHQALYDLANLLQKDLNLDDFQATLLQFYAYSKKHFEAEEFLMLQIVYPAYDVHRDKHDRLLGELAEAISLVLENPLHKPALLVVVDRCVTHFNSADQALGAYYVATTNLRLAS